MNPMMCTTQDGVKNVFRDVQVISSIEKDQVRLMIFGRISKISCFECFKVLNLVRDYGVKMKEILVYERIVEAVQVTLL